MSGALSVRLAGLACRGSLVVLALVAAACADGDDLAPPATVAVSVAADPDGPALLVTPATALRGASAYGLVVTTRLRDARGQPLERSEAFAGAAGLGPPSGDGPRALYADDPEAPGNPYPDARLAAADGTLHVPDWYALRGLGDEEATATARRIMRGYADSLGSLGGFSTTAPLRVALSTPIDLETATPESILLFELPPDAVSLAADRAQALDAVLDVAAAAGVAREEVAVAIWFPTLPIEDDLLSIQGLLADRIGSDAVTFDDPDPDDDLSIGFFPAGDPTFASYLSEHPEVAAVAVGLIAAPEFRGPDQVFETDRVRGTAPAPAVLLDFYVTLPTRGSPPHPVVLFQHGFGGSNEGVLDLGPLFAAEGLATIGISAVHHGRRGSALDLLTSSPFQLRDTFRQSNADQMSVLRAIEAGLDVDGDGSPDLDAGRTSYLGISLGGIMGATLVAVEPILPVAVLNVAGGRIAFLGNSEGARGIFTDALSRQVGLEVSDPRFEVFLRRQFEIGQHALDPVDGLNFAPHWFLDPFPGSEPHRVLLQEGIGDLLVDNANTEALAAAGGLEANVPMSDPAGVSGLWRFAPPGGHGIFGRPDVRAQALRFLLSGGTEIIDPSATAGASAAVD
jgi:hypothetical protein